MIIDKSIIELTFIHSSLSVSSCFYFVHRLLKHFNSISNKFKKQITWHWKITLDVTNLTNYQLLIYDQMKPKGGGRQSNPAKFWNQADTSDATTGTVCHKYRIWFRTL